ncbi:hypothetical protein BGZ52_013243 [Haplosporangium bisporale]|nr:hypothetical protein BGZ52_013243 [Haplosporangium bisporale]
MSTTHLSPSQTRTLAIAFTVAIVKNTPPGVPAAGKPPYYFLANKHLWFTDAINNTLEETHAPEKEDAPGSRSSPFEGDALTRRDEEAYKRQLGNMNIKMELLKSQHQVEMEDLRCQLKATSRKRKKRLAPGGGEEDETFEPRPSQRYQPQEADMDDQVSSDFADHNVRNAFVVLKNMNLLQENIHALSLGSESRWSMQPSGQENMILAATNSMCTVIGALTDSVVTAVNSLVEAPSMRMGELDASLERYKTHMRTIQECMSSFTSDLDPVRKVYMDLERSWLELLNLTHARETTPMATTDMASVTTPAVLGSLFTTVLSSTSRPDQLDNHTFLVKRLLRIVLRTLTERLGQVVESDRATAPIQEEPPLRSCTRSSAKAKVGTRLRAGHSALSTYYRGLHFKKECGWIIEQFVMAVKRPGSVPLVQRAFSQDVLMHGDLAVLIQKLSSFVQFDPSGPDTRLSPGWLTEMLLELLVILPS